MATTLKAPQVSIIVPIFNTAAFLEKCLLSIKNQSFRDIEILLVDDATPDESVTIARKFTATDDRFKLLRHDRNKGLGPARNTGIEHATAPWIIFVDSDDWIDTDCVQALYRSVKTHAADMAQCGMKWVYAAHTLIRPKTPSPFSLIRGRNIVLTYNQWNVPASVLCMTWGKIYRKDLFTKNRIHFPNIIGEDFPTTYQLCYFARRAIVQSTPYYYYRQRCSSIMGAEISEKTIRDLFITLQIIYDFLKKQHPQPEIDAHFKKLALNQIVWYMLRKLNNIYYDNPEKLLQMLKMVDRYYLEYQPILNFDNRYVKYSLRIVKEINPGLLLDCLGSYQQNFSSKYIFKGMLNLFLFTLGNKIIDSNYVSESIEARKLIELLVHLYKTKLIKFMH